MVWGALRNSLVQQGNRLDLDQPIRTGQSLHHMECVGRKGRRKDLVPRRSEGFQIRRVRDERRHLEDPIQFRSLIAQHGPQVCKYLSRLCLDITLAHHLPGLERRPLL